MSYKLLIIFLSLCLFSCKTPYQGLRKLSSEQVYARFKQLKLDPDQVRCLDERRHDISKTAILAFNRDSFAVDRYVDRSDTVRLWALRPIREEDRVLRQKLKDLYDSDVDYRIKYIQATVKDTALRNNMLSMVYYDLAIKPVEVDCDSTVQVLEAVLWADQENRQARGIDGKIDWQNQVKVVSIIEHCGFPASVAENQTSIYAIFMVVQHAGPGLRKKYFPLLQQAAAAGALEKSALALMEDRMLTDEGKHQKYGSQLRWTAASGKFESYPVEDPQNIEKRRALLWVFIRHPVRLG